METFKIKKNHKDLNAACKVVSINHQLGLTLESGDGKGRNSDYNIALELLLDRLLNIGIKSIRITIVSEDLLKHFPSSIDRTIEIDSATNIIIEFANVHFLNK